MIGLGVDLATTPAGTWSCAIGWDAGAPHVTDPVGGLADDALVAHPVPAPDGGRGSRCDGHPAAEPLGRPARDDRDAPHVASASPRPRAVVDALSPRSGIAVDDARRARLVEVGDALDALVCALVARAVRLGLTGTPAPGAEIETARREGRIHTPSSGALERLAGP